MNVEKMRRASERIAEQEQQRERAAWLDSLTPEHRELHERGFGLVCNECMARSVDAAAERFREAFEAMRRTKVGQ